MAMFREHVAVGAIVSMVIVVGVYFYALVTDPLLLIVLFGVSVIGSFLPDVDSDSGIPFYLVFGTATLAATGVVLLHTLSSEYASDWRYLIGIPALAMLLFWFVVGGVIKRCTHHRGIFHSIPALAIAGAATFLVARYFGLDGMVSLVFGVAMALGFATHLVLDELHAGITLNGIPFIPKKSLGTALKLFSNSGGVNVATYLILAALVYIALQPTAFAQTFYNDSDVVGIEGSAPPEDEEDSGAGGGSDPGEEEGSGSSGGSGGSGGSSSGGGGGGGSSSGGSSGGSGSGSGSGSGETPDDVINELLNSGAISGLSAGSGTGQGSGANSAFGAFGSGAGSSISIVGEKVRNALRGKVDLQSVLDGWRSLRGKNGTSARDISLMAASTALSDSNMEEIQFTADRFDITYRSRGYLIGFLPWTFSVRVGVVPQAPEGSKVNVKLPWYHWFVREFFTRSGLAADIEEEMKMAAASDAAAADADQTALLFEVVAQLLRHKVGTVGSSVLTQ